MSRYQNYIKKGYTPSSAVSEVINDIRRQYALWPTTVSECRTDGCNNAARDGYCANCLTKDLGEATGRHRGAKEFLRLTREAHAEACLMLQAMRDK